MSLNWLGGTQYNVSRGNDGIPDQFMPAPPIFDIIWTRLKMLFQCDYAWEEVFNLVPDVDGFLHMGSSKKGRR